MYLANVARINVQQRQATWAIQLLAAALNFIKTGKGEPMAPQGVKEIESQLTRFQGQVDSEDFELAFQRGQLLDVAAALAMTEELA